MTYQLTIDHRTNDHDRLEVYIFGTLEQAKQAAEDKLNGRAGGLFFEIDPVE